MENNHDLPLIPISTGPCDFAIINSKHSELPDYNTIDHK